MPSLHVSSPQSWNLRICSCVWRKGFARVTSEGVQLGEALDCPGGSQAAQAPREAGMEPGRAVMLGARLGDMAESRQHEAQEPGNRTIRVKGQEGGPGNGHRHRAATDLGVGSAPVRDPSPPLSRDHLGLFLASEGSMRPCFLRALRFLTKVRRKSGESAGKRQAGCQCLQGARVPHLGE